MEQQKIDIAKIKIGDLDEFELMYKKYIRPVYSYILKILENKDDVEEILQEVFSSIWQQRQTIHSENLIWIISKRKCIDYIRKKKAVFLSSEEWSSLCKICSNEEKTIEKEEQSFLVEKLSSQEKEVVLLAIEGSSRQEIANILEIPLGTVDSRLNRIKRKLQRRSANG